jgi:hypothetical protein
VLGGAAALGAALGVEVCGCAGAGPPSGEADGLVIRGPICAEVLQTAPNKPKLNATIVNARINSPHPNPSTLNVATEDE